MKRIRNLHNTDTGKAAWLFGVTYGSPSRFNQSTRFHATSLNRIIFFRPMITNAENIVPAQETISKIFNIYRSIVFRHVYRNVAHFHFSWVKCFISYQFLHGYVLCKIGTVCPRSSDPFYVVTYYIKWVTTSWIYSTMVLLPDDYPPLNISVVHHLGIWIRRGVTRITYKNWIRIPYRSSSLIIGSDFHVNVQSIE